MFLRTLSGRFLGLTIVFVLIAEVLIFVPSVARFRFDYLQNRLDQAQLAALAALATPEGLPQEVQAELLATADVLIVVLQREGVRELALVTEMPPEQQAKYDLREVGPLTMIRDAIGVFLTGHDRIIRVIGNTRQGSEGVVDVMLEEAPLRSEMVEYGRRILLISLAISAATAALLFLLVQHLIVRPIMRLIDHMTAYRDDPEDATLIIAPTNETREIHQAESALQDLEVRLTAALRQKERLAALGRAVASSLRFKILHSF
jgi:hypothetical protein